MREIKFRAWDTTENEFVNIKSFGFLEDGEVWYVQAIDEHEQEIDPPYFTGEDELVIMQYTGLKDKNGKEIYEGDIVKQTGDGFLNNTCHEVYFRFCGFRMNIRPIEDVDEIYELEVIGNVFEDKHLLEDN